MQAWQLPEYIADILPSSAYCLENAKEKLLTLFRSYGYQLVMPPMLEYTNSLLTRIDKGLSLKTVRVTDQLSGFQIGVRADITTQISRIDAHVLSSNTGVNRLCYAGNVIHAKPETLYSTRDPLQVGAEIYGCADIEADIELVDLMLKSVAILGIEKPLLSLGHINIFRSLAKTAQLSPEQIESLLNLIQVKDNEAVSNWCQQNRQPEKLSLSFCALTKLYGTPEYVLSNAKQMLPTSAEITSALDNLQRMCQTFKDYTIHIDLSELRRDNYHNGLLFAAYRTGDSDALVRGGRYDGLGQYFGRSRPASGFSLDLKNFLDFTHQQQVVSGIYVNVTDAQKAAEAIQTLRQNGEIVIVDYINEGAKSLNCNRQLIRQNDEWKVIEITKD